jgi:biofilm PGA synthesis N-glycosyltransferase PgaC
MAKGIFLISTMLLVYNYLLYPIAMILLARWRRPAPELIASAPAYRQLPSVALIIAAYNEERVIEAKIRNSLELDYPNEQLRVLVVSDGSTDSTPDIVNRYHHDGVVSLHQPERLGKTAAINRAVAVATEDIIVFSDANNMFQASALRELVKHFSDPSIGGVCGLKQIYSMPGRESSRGDSLYWKYESAIKEAESRLGSITTADGEIFALRRTLYEAVDESVINDDAEITFLLVRKGYRVVYERRALSYEHASIRIEDDFHVKVRMVSGGFQTVARYWTFLLPPRTWFAFTFLSHKVLRWLAAEFMILIAFSSLWLASRPFFLLVVILQAIFYILAFAGWLTRERERRPDATYVPFYFCAMNLAAFRGLWRFLTRAQPTQWRKAER